MSRDAILAERLCSFCPLLEKLYPPRWVDFRSPLPAEWRAGLFFRIGSSDDGPLRLKSMFGSVSVAVAAAVQVSEVLGITVRIEPPHTEEVGCDGEYSKIKVVFWQIFFEIPPLQLAMLPSLHEVAAQPVPPIK